MDLHGVPRRLLLAAIAFSSLSCSTSGRVADGTSTDRPADAPPFRPSSFAEATEGMAGRSLGEGRPMGGEAAAAPSEAPEEAVPTPRGDPADDPVMAEVARATGAHFSALDVGPYRAIVEGSPERARAVVARTVRPVVKALRTQYFEKEPVPVVRLVLFTRDETFRTGAEALSGEPPDTPFGYYSPYLRAVVMNLATGGGTLVHEMVHTFVEEDFPDCPAFSRAPAEPDASCPAWLNEGLASLYEQCRIAPERLVGLTNWRLPALQEALARDVDSGPARPGVLARVVATSSDEFYGAGSGLNYAVARYLCYDLQEHGLLERFYREFREDSRKAHSSSEVPREVASGRRTLERVLGRTLDEYEPEWRERTMKLRFPRR